MLRIRRAFRLEKPLNRSSNFHAHGGQNTPPNKNFAAQFMSWGPTLTALLFAGIGSSGAHAQGTMNFSGAQTLMSTFKSPFGASFYAVCICNSILTPSLL